MNCGLCKQPIRGDERFTTDHYNCGVVLHQSFRDDVAALLAALKLVVASAVPNPVEHPRMAIAFEAARMAIARVEGR